MSKIEQFWQDATADDVAGIANTRKPISARARDEDTGHWRLVLLAGWKLARFDPGAIWIDADGAMWNHCQVYREPSWWTDKPDPGPGYRLLGKLPDEELKPGDEYFDRPTGRWHLSGHAKTQQQQLTETWYRRRIEPVEPKFAVGRLVRVVGPKGSDAKQWSEEMNKHIGKESAVSNRENKDAGWFYELGCSATWAFREDYLEPVEPVESKPVLIRRRVVEIGDELKLPNGSVWVFRGEGFEVKQ
jgi:hypothetical protein